MLFRLLYQVKKPIIQSLIFLLLTVVLLQYVIYVINSQKEKYESGFIYEDKTQTQIEGTIKTFPSYRFVNNQYILHVKNSSTRILVTTQPFQKFSYLETLTFSASLTDVRSQGKEWENYYKKLNVQYVVFYPSITETHFQSPQNVQQKIMYRLFVFKTDLRNRTAQRFSSRASALIIGMLLGGKDELSKEEKELFTTANLSHILVVSGYNISIFLAAIFFLLKSFHRYLRACIAMTCVLFFVLLVGLDASIVRSALMGCIILFSQLIRRKTSGVHTLFLVGTIMLLLNPFSIFDAGFHLSFLATYSLLILPKFKRIPEYVATTVWVSAFVSVYILYLSGSMSFGGIFINILVLVFVPIFMLVSFMSLGISLVGIPIGVDILIIEMITRYIFMMTQLVTVITPYTYNITPHIAVLFYGVLLSVVGFVQNRYTTPQFIEKRYQKFVPQKPN